MLRPRSVRLLLAAVLAGQLVADVRGSGRNAAGDSAAAGRQPDEPGQAANPPPVWRSGWPRLPSFISPKDLSSGLLVWMNSPVVR